MLNSISVAITNITILIDKLKYAQSNKVNELLNSFKINAALRL